MGKALTGMGSSVFVVFLFFNFYPKMTLLEEEPAGVEMVMELSRG